MKSCKEKLITSTTVIANNTLVEKACAYTGANAPRTISLVILACLNESNVRNLKHPTEEYLLLQSYAVRHDTKIYNIRGKKCVDALKELTQKLKSIDNSIDNASKAVNHALFQFITEYEKEKPLERPIKLLGSKWNPKMQSPIHKILEKVNCTSVVETCAGALGIFCNMNTPEECVLNDIDKNKIALYRCIQNDCAKLLVNFLQQDKNEDIYNAKKKKLTESGQLSEFERASLLLYLSCYDKSWCKFEYNKQAPLASLDNVCNYLRIAEKLQGVVFKTKDLLKLIPEYLENENTLIICDPPYEDTKSYQSNLSSKEHKKLAKMLNSHQGQYIYFCRITANGKNPEHDSKIIKAKVEDNYANQKEKKTYYIDVELPAHNSKQSQEDESSTEEKKPAPPIIERIITNFEFDGSTEFTLPTNTGKKGGDSNEK